MNFKTKLMAYGSYDSEATEQQVELLKKSWIFQRILLFLHVIERNKTALRNGSSKTSWNIGKSSIIWNWVDTEI